MPQSKKILVLGGSFNPPHLGHQLMAQQILQAKLVDGLWFLPVGLHDFGKEVVEAKHRLAMLKLMLLDLKKNLQASDHWQAWPYFLRIEDFELRDSGLSCTLNTLEALASTYPQFEFSFLIGSDNLPAFHRWFDRQGRDYQQLLNNFEIKVYPREGFPMTPLYPGMTALTDFSKMAISSTQLRQLLLQLQAEPSVKEQILPLLNPAVFLYIMEHCLYQN